MVAGLGAEGLGAAAPVIELVQISDTHLPDRGGQCVRGLDPWAHFDALCAHLQGPARVDAILHTGDVAQGGTPATYRSVAQRLGGCAERVWLLAGNHDDPRALAAIEPEAASGLVVRDLGAWQVIGLNSHDRGRVAGRLGAEQLEALRGALEAARKPTLIALHHPLAAVGTPALDAHVLTERRQVLEWIAATPWIRGVIFGHIHQPSQGRTASGQALLGTPAVSFQFARGTRRVTVDTRSDPGYRRLLLEDDGSWQSEVVRFAAPEPMRGDW
nr:metallophosphoesterase [Halorhodospira halophila]